MCELMREFACVHFVLDFGVQIRIIKFICTLFIWENERAHRKTELCQGGGKEKETLRNYTIEMQRYMFRMQ